MAHLYGDTLYYATSLYDYYVNGISHSRPEVLYFWVYYFLMNFVWIVVPACKFVIFHWSITILMISIDLLYNSVCLVSQAMKRFDGEAGAKKTR
jgi:cholestenol delta-isomerase